MTSALMPAAPAGRPAVAGRGYDREQRVELDDVASVSAHDGRQPVRSAAARRRERRELWRSLLLYLPLLAIITHSIASRPNTRAATTRD